MARTCCSIHCCALVSGFQLGCCVRPAAQIIALNDDCVWLGRQGPAGFQVQSGQMEASLPADGPGGAPGGVDVFQCFAAFLGEYPCGGPGREAFFAAPCGLVRPFRGRALVPQPCPDRIAPHSDGVEGGE